MNGLPDELSLVNAALALIGQHAIVSFDEETDLADLCVRLYDTIVDSVLTAHAWQHLQKTQPLQRLAETPVNGWRFAFQAPADALGPPRKLLADPRQPDSPLRRFALEGVTIYADEPALWGLYVRRLSPDQWTPSLRLALTRALAADLCVPVCEDKDLAAQLRADAFGPPQMQGQGGLLAKALAADAAAAPQHAPLLAPGFEAALPSDWYRS